MLLKEVQRAVYLSDRTHYHNYFEIIKLTSLTWAHFHSLTVPIHPTTSFIHCMLFNTSQSLIDIAWFHHIFHFATITITIDLSTERKRKSRAYLIFLHMNRILFYLHKNNTVLRYFLKCHLLRIVIYRKNQLRIILLDF